MRLIGALFVMVLLMVPRPGSAQSLALPAEPDRHWFFVDFNFAGGVESLAAEREFLTRFLVVGELATLQARYPKPSGARAFPLLDVSGGYMLGPRAGFAVGFSRSSFEDRATITATVPHPFFLQTEGTATGQTDPLTRTESATHFSVILMPYTTRRTEWRAVLGPTLFFYSADMVTDITYSQNAVQGNPQNIVTLTGYTTEEASGKAFGVHIGGDFAFDIVPNVAITAGGRYAIGTVAIEPEPLSGISQDIRVGDWRLFVGLRWRVGKSSQ